MKSTHIILICGLVLTILSGILRGKLDSRWSSDELVAAAERVNAMPHQLGAWTAEEIKPLPEPAVEMLRCPGSAVGAYSNSKGDLVSAVFLVGPAGPLAVHTPDVCYGSSNYTIHEPTRHTTIVDANGNKHSFSVITFRENSAGNRLLRVYFAWHDKGSWIAPDVPRTAFAGIPMLYKLQVATHLVTKDETNLDAGERFLRDSLPLLQQMLK